jgi:hypothetical protein
MWVRATPGCSRMWLRYEFAFVNNTGQRFTGTVWMNGATFDDVRHEVEHRMGVASLPLMWHYFRPCLDQDQPPLGHPLKGALDGVEGTLIGHPDPTGLGRPLAP